MNLAIARGFVCLVINIYKMQDWLKCLDIVSKKLKINNFNVVCGVYLKIYIYLFISLF